LPFLAQHVRHITGVRLADRRMSDGARTWLGQGDARVREVLQAMREHGWAFEATVDIEYDLANDVDQMTEIRRALAYCRSI
jgi:sugar phosphate isomerase/epimerase